eukprot:scaffold3190_cov409-Prasinococcus_capsulatus_cf.AAC.23
MILNYHVHDIAFVDQVALPGWKAKGGVGNAVLLTQTSARACHGEAVRTGVRMYAPAYELEALIEPHSGPSYLRQ